MKQFKIPTSFYIIFSLILSVPALWLSKVIAFAITSLCKGKYFQGLADLGIIQAPTTVLVLLFFFWILNNWVWKIKLVSKIFNLPSNINGRYEGDLVSSYDDTKKFPIVIEITQSLTDINVCLYGENSKSYTMSYSIGKDNHGNWCLVYVYQNQTSTVNHDEDMKDHGGVALLNVFEGGSNLKGNYFNNPRDRGRFGTINVHRVSLELLKKFK